MGKRLTGLLKEVGRRVEAEKTILTIFRRTRRR